MCISTQNGLVERLIDELIRAADLIQKIDKETFVKSANGTGSVGGHFRHNLDFATSILNGISEGKIDYERRGRDVKVETDRQYAVEKYIEVIRRVIGVSPDDLNKAVLVRSEINETCWHRSSISRELEFVLSHTVHHHALISEKLAFFGIETSPDFGVAPSTLKYWEQQKIAA
jgi:hypothetical protein